MMQLQRLRLKASQCSGRVDCICYFAAVNFVSNLEQVRELLIRGPLILPYLEWP
jgi:hypothetical protein